MTRLRHAEATCHGVNLWAPDQDRLLAVIPYETPGEAMVRRAQRQIERRAGRNRAWREEHRRKGLA